MINFEDWWSQKSLKDAGGQPQPPVKTMIIGLQKCLGVKPSRGGASESGIMLFNVQVLISRALGSQGLKS